MLFTGVSRFFAFIFNCSGFHSEIALHHFCEWEKKAVFIGESIAPLLTRMFFDRLRSAAFPAADS